MNYRCRLGSLGNLFTASGSAIKQTTTISRGEIVLVTEASLIKHDTIIIMVIISSYNFMMSK